MKNKIVIGVIFLALSAFVVSRGMTNKSLDTYTIGQVTAKQSLQNKVDKLRIQFKVQGKKYNSYFSPSNEAFDLINKGYKVMVKYSKKDPNQNSPVPFSQDASLFIDTVLRVGLINKISSFTQLNFIIDKEQYFEIFYSYTFNNLKYSGVSFAKSDSMLEVGQEFYVHIDGINPQISRINLNKPFDEQSMINSILELEKQYISTDSIPNLNDTIIDGDTVQVLELESH